MITESIILQTFKNIGSSSNLGSCQLPLTIDRPLQSICKVSTYERSAISSLSGRSQGPVTVTGYLPARKTNGKLWVSAEYILVSKQEQFALRSV